MKKLLLIGFASVVVFFAFQQRSATWSPPQNVIPATERPLVKFTPAAFASDRAKATVGLVEDAELRAASAKAIKLIHHAQADWYKKET